jgi:hypothetical protein
LPGTERLKVRYGAVLEIRKNKGAKAGAQARKDKDKAAMPLFDRKITQGFELRPPTRAVTRRLEFRAGKETPTGVEGGISVILDGKPSVRKFRQVPLRAVVLSVVGTGWRLRLLIAYGGRQQEVI